MFQKGALTILLLILSNTFMTFAWYGHLKFSQWKTFEKLGIVSVIFISWFIALFEYMFQVPANKIGFQGNGGPFNLLQLKIIQEAVTLIVFTIFTVIFFKNQTLKWNHMLAFLFIIAAVYLVFKE